jgi:hypothetical protein
MPHLTSEFGAPHLIADSYIPHELHTYTHPSHIFIQLHKSWLGSRRLTHIPRPCHTNIDHWLSDAFKLPSLTSSSEGDASSVQSMAWDPGQPDVWYHRWDPDRCSGERDRTSLSVAWLPTFVWQKNEALEQKNVVVRNVNHLNSLGFHCYFWCNTVYKAVCYRDSAAAVVFEKTFPSYSSYFESSLIRLLFSGSFSWISNSWMYCSICSPSSVSFSNSGAVDVDFFLRGELLSWSSIQFNCCKQD